MSVPNSVEELIQLIRKSGMIEDDRLNDYIERRRGPAGMNQDPRDEADAMVRYGLLTHFQAEQFLLGKWRGFTVGKYKLLERVGVGGMGQVFLCQHLYMNRRVAIKVLPPAKADQPAALGRFYREARAAGSLEHPNIVRTLDIDQDGSLHYIVMEYVRGSNLLDTVKGFGPLSVARTCSYMKQVADGLEFAYRKGIIHRDVKPGNILVDKDGHAKVLDMGLARFYNDQADQLTVKYDDKIVLGTADYVAPEQVANSHAVDVRADVYALGASMYFLLAGHPPFPTGTVSQKLLWHRTKDPTPLKQIRPELPEELVAIVAKMMAKDPKARFQTPAAVAEVLTPWIPEVVELPSKKEIPALSIAAEEPDTELLSHDPGVETYAPKQAVMSQRVSAYAEAQPAAVRTPKSSREPVTATATAVREVDLQPEPFGGRPKSTPRVNRGVFAPETNTPKPLHAPAQAVQRQAQVGEMVMLEEPPPSMRFYALIAAIISTTILAAGILYWKFS